MQPYRKKLSILTVVLAIMVLPGCVTSKFLDTTTRGIFLRQDVNLKERNSAAADYLVQQARTFIGDDDLIQAITLHEDGNPQISSEIGRLISEQAGIRLGQLGYRMDLENVLGTSDDAFLKQPVTQGETPDFILSGNYRRENQDLNVNLRLTDTQNQRVVGAFNYNIPMNNEVAALSEPQAKIFRVSE